MPCQLHSFNKHTWLTLSIGFLLALGVYHILWLQAIIYPLVTITHELGHTLVGWLFGYPSFPSFDLRRGESMTIHGHQNLAMLFTIYLGFATWLCVYSRNLRNLIIVFVSIGSYSIILSTQLSNALIIFMGHGAELILASILLYFAIANDSLLLRPLVALLGFFIIMYDLSFAYKLKYDVSYQLIYAYQGGQTGLGDFSQLALMYFDGKVPTVANLFFWCCFLPPMGSFLRFCYQNQKTELDSDESDSD